MNFKFFIISTLITFSLIGGAFAQTPTTIDKDFTEEEVDEMKGKAVLITLAETSFTIELFPEDAPHTVYNFLKLVESGYYDGIVFHRIIPGFMIQAGDPNTKDPEFNPNNWGQGGPGYTIASEFNTIEHDRGIVSMARSNHPDSAGSQFFIVHKDANHLDGQYTVFGRLVPGLSHGLDYVANLETNDKNRPVDVFKATIKEAKILSDFSSTDFNPPDRKESVITEKQSSGGGTINVYENTLHNVKFNLPYRWLPVSEKTGDYFSTILEPQLLEHNAMQQAERSGFMPQVIVGSEKRTAWELENDEISTAFFSVGQGDEPKVLSNYIFTNEDGVRAHLVVSTQNVEAGSETAKFKIIQIHFNNSETNYSVIYLNLTEYFRYEINAFQQTLDDFEIMIDGKMQEVDFTDSPVFRQVINDEREKPEPESLPPARIGGCLIATASYGSELAPQVQLLREIRDNTVLQTQSGTSFMNGFNHFYYSFSPTIADYERENPVFKEAVKLTLTPLLVSLTLLQYTDIDSEHEMLGYGIGLILLNIGIYFITPAILITKIRSFYKLQ